MRLIGLLATTTLLMPQLATAQFVRHNSIPEVYWGPGAHGPNLRGCKQVGHSSYRSKHMRAPRPAASFSRDQRESLVGGTWRARGRERGFRPPATEKPTMASVSPPRYSCATWRLNSIE
jgi:hypothetical protein